MSGTERREHESLSRAVVDEPKLGQSDRHPVEKMSGTRLPNAIGPGPRRKFDAPIERNLVDEGQSSASCFTSA